MTVDPDSPVGRNLAQWRNATTDPEAPVDPKTGKRRHYSQRRVADELGVIKRTIQKWELNESTPAWKYLRMLADLYGTTVPSFFAQHGSGNDRGEAA